MNKIDSDPCW